MKKNIISLALIALLTLVFVLSGCGGQTAVTTPMPEATAVLLAVAPTAEPTAVPAIQAITLTDGLGSAIELTDRKSVV